MPSNVGNQTISIFYRAVANSSEWNKRNVGIIRTGIYTGGWLTLINSTTARISALSCEISDGTYQIRVSTSETANMAVSSATPYIVLRWSYGGTINDYMEILAVATPATNDLIVGKCTFSGGGALNGFDYSERSDPSTKDGFLKVEPTGESELRVRIRGGYIQLPNSSVQIQDQKSDAIVPPSANSKVYLIYVDTDGTVRVDSTGTEAADPSAPSYGNKLVLAEVTVSAGDTSILASQITDVRPFISKTVPHVDGTTITTDASGNLKKVDPTYLVQVSSGDQVIAITSWTKVDLGSTIKVSGITQGDDTFTLNAGKLYKISYNIRFGSYSDLYHIYGSARFRVVSGDTLWSMDNDNLNVSLSSFSQIEPIVANDRVQNFTLSWSGIILPASSTVIQLEALTRSGNLMGKVTGVSINVFSD